MFLGYGKFFEFYFLFIFINTYLYWTHNQRQSTQQQERGRTYRADNGETIVDYRNPQETGRKIFTKDEGEYVDYEEEK